MALWTIKIFKSWRARDPERRWSNTYELESDLTTPTALIATAEALADAEREIHLTDVQFLSAIISTWTADSTPYNPLSFTTVPLEGTGLRGNDTGINDNALDSNVCLLYSFAPTTGRAGKRFYRGVLLETDVKIGGDGRFTFDPAGPWEAGSEKSAFQVAMAPYLAPAAGDTTIVLVGEPDAVGGGVLSRAVNSILSLSIVTNRRNHRYFDRA